MFVCRQSAAQIGRAGCLTTKHLRQPNFNNTIKDGKYFILGTDLSVLF
jgi:hypothetical protein